MTPRRGLTLLEVLAATALLTFVASAGLTIMRQASRSQHVAVRAAFATEAVRSWSNEYSAERLAVQVDGDDAQALTMNWEYRDARDGMWRARVTEIPNALNLQPTTNEAEPEPAEPLRWLEVVFEHKEAEFGRYVPVTTLVRAISPRGIRPGEPR